MVEHSETDELSSMGELDFELKGAGDLATLGSPAALGLGIHWVMCAGVDVHVV